MNRHDLEIYDAIENDVNGGSVLVAIGHKDTKEKSQRYLELLNSEKKFNLSDENTYYDFYKQILSLKEKVNLYIRNCLNSRRYYWYKIV